MKFKNLANWKNILLAIILLALILRIGPVFVFQMPLSYDTPFHVRIADSIIEKGFFPEFEQGIEKKPNSYPPLYHILLASISIFSSKEVFPIAMVLLPFFASLIPLSAFLLVRRLSNAKNALMAALLIAISTPLIAASFDSPEAIMFLIIPIVFLLLHFKKKILPAFFFALSLLLNYFFLLVTIIPFLFSARKQKKVFFLAIFFLALFSLFYIPISGLLPIQIKSLNTGIAFIAFNLKDSLPILVGITIVFSIPILFFCLKQKQLGFFPAALLAFSLFVLVLSLFFVGLRPWELIKFVSFAGIISLLSLKLGKIEKRFLLMLGIMLFIFSLIFSFQFLFPRLFGEETNAIQFLNNEEVNGNILAEPSFSEYLKLFSLHSEKTLTSLYFENSSQKSQLPHYLQYLMNQGIADEQAFLEKNKIEFVLLDFEDKMNRGIEKFDEKEWFDKTYSLSFEKKCLFFESEKSMCGKMETFLLKNNEFEKNN